MRQLEDAVRSSDNNAVQLRVWDKEAKRKEEEEWMFLKQKSSEEIVNKLLTYGL